MLAFALVIAFSQGSFAGDEGLDVTFKCGDTLPQGELQYSGKFHKEIAGASFEHVSATYGGTRTIQRRYAILRGANCWIEYYVTGIPSPNGRSTGTFDEVYKSTPLYPVHEDMGKLGSLDRGSLSSFLIHISREAAACDKTFKPYLRSYLKSDYGRELSLAEARSYSKAANKYSKCISRTVDRVNGQGFVGVWSDGALNRGGFAWISGKLYKFDF